MMRVHVGVNRSSLEYNENTEQKCYCGMEKGMSTEVYWGHGFMVYYNALCILGHQNVITN